MIEFEKTLWIHGWGTSPAVWASMTGEIPANPQFTADRASSPERLLSSVIESANAAAIESLIGWSLGGMLALAGAARIPSLKRLVLLGCAPTFCRKPGILGWPELALKKMHTEHLKSPETVRSRFLRDQLPEHPTLLDLDNDMGSAGLLFLKQADLREDAAGLQIPILQIHGETDPLFPCLTIEEATTVFPSARLSFSAIPNASHAPFLDAPEHCRNLITNFIQRDS